MSNCFYIFRFHLFLTDGLFSFTIKTLFTRITDTLATKTIPNLVIFFCPHA